MELKIFKKKNVSFLEMLEFLIKFIFYFDTSELFLKEKKNNKLFRKNKRDTLSLFDYCFYSNSELDKLIDILNCQSGGASGDSNSTSASASASDSTSKSSNASPESLEDPKKDEGGNGNSEKGNAEKGNGGNEGSGESNGEKKNDEEKQQGLMQFIEEIKDSIEKGINYIKTKVMAIISLIVYASIYPAIPFFLIMATMYGTLKYFMYKFRNF